MTTSGRALPRFIPTLTEVVPEAEPASPVPAPAAASLPEPQATPPAAPPAPVPTASGSPALPEDFEEYLVHRVMQRIDLALEARLREAIARVTLEQTRSLVPRLREEVETVVRQSVYEAVAQELAGERHQP